MSALALILVIGGFAVLAIGIFFLFRPPAAPPPQGTPEALPDIGKWLEELRKFLEAFDQRLRVGMTLTLIGFALIALGVFVDVRDTKDEVKETPAALIVRTN